VVSLGDLGDDGKQIVQRLVVSREVRQADERSDGVAEGVGVDEGGVAGDDPASPSRRTRSAVALGDSATRRARSAVLMRPSDCRASRIDSSVRSSVIRGLFGI
jgi:hypothetical protein